VSIVNYCDFPSIEQKVQLLKLNQKSEEVLIILSRLDKVEAIRYWPVAVFAVASAKNKNEKFESIWADTVSSINMECPEKRMSYLVQTREE
jgi:hypothetical protein